MVQKTIEMFKELVKSRLGYIPSNVELLCEKQPGAVAEFVRLYGTVMRKGALDVKTKELIGLAVATALNCTHCMEWHTRAALEAGATEEEIAETLAVVMLMTGGPGLITFPETVAEILKKERK